MIRNATEKDIEDIYKLGILLNQNFSNTYNINDYLKNHNYIILVNGYDRINAFLIVYKNLDFFELEAIAVDSNIRRQGIASSLISYFIKHYTNDKDIILLEVAVNNIGAVNLYKNFDFKVINTREKYYNNIDAYVMKKVI